MTFSTLGIWEVGSHLVDLAVAYALALPIGWEREREARSAGIRTFPLVAVAACGFVLVAIRVLGASSTGQARILEGLITGVGFIGGGAILKHAGRASGTATAASLWTTGAVGAAVGYGLDDIGAILSLVTFLTLRCLAPLKEAAREAGGDDGTGDGPDASPSRLG
ncbi:MgtC/SapB family protein [Methylorubrum populi]|uniref:MgtC/SapB family protein n=1 Tax=Methylorubrum rhodesianum TaxID=29427 RepID=UPI00190E45DE|nr:MgtC/SapB family protein [Methylorubrum rhodesianum]MBK3405184.1 MgtC/SapB family protein [Methylorubrum rhodesianum]MBY0138681.1 MgtC/SapB family protein [Methylorubrum populi]